MALRRPACEHAAAARAGDEAGAVDGRVGAHGLFEEAGARQLGVGLGQLPAVRPLRLLLFGRDEDEGRAPLEARAARHARGGAPRGAAREVVERPVDVVQHGARQQRLLRALVELREQQRREAGRAAVREHLRRQRIRRELLAVEQVGGELVGVGVGLEDGARLGEVVQKGEHLADDALLRRAPLRLGRTMQHVQPAHL